MNTFSRHMQGDVESQRDGKAAQVVEKRSVVELMGMDVNRLSLTDETVVQEEKPEDSVWRDVADVKDALIGLFTQENEVASQCESEMKDELEALVRGGEILVG